MLCARSRELRRRCRRARSRELRRRRRRRHAARGPPSDGQREDVSRSVETPHALAKPGRLGALEFGQPSMHLSPAHRPSQKQVMTSMQTVRAVRAHVALLSRAPVASNGRGQTTAHGSPLKSPDLKQSADDCTAYAQHMPAHGRARQTANNITPSFLTPSLVPRAPRPAHSSLSRLTRGGRPTSRAAGSACS
jgi:hypothetical protein